MTETEACIALNMVPKLGPVRLRRLLDVFGTPQRILLAKANELRGVEGIGPEIADAVAHWETHVDLSAELARIAEFGAHVITQADPVYPPLLREIHNPPIVLYVWGELLEKDRHALGIVGSRKTSHYGLESAKKLSYQLAYAGLTIVSGLARGIDTAAHQGALAAKGRTVAVLGSGLLNLYPAENQALAEKIAASGAVVTEFPMCVAPDVQTFPQRNRIVSGWSDGLLVVEAGLKSGALITAGQAAEQGRSVFAVPGQIDKNTSAGSNRLIQQGAKLVMGAADILDDLQILLPEKPHLEQSPARTVEFTGNERAVYDAISEGETAIDTIITKSGLPPGAVSSTLLALEMKRLVKQLPGQHFVKLL
ncbi:MAG: DNA-processing protein DprA [Verrucomicrobia bacterium]|nr:DNA-processing protein DprA [Verrucomicrobiota bacterium]